MVVVEEDFYTKQKYPIYLTILVFGTIVITRFAEIIIPNNGNIRHIIDPGPRFLIGIIFGIILFLEFLVLALWIKSTYKNYSSPE